MDALAIAVAYWTEQMSANVDKRIEERKKLDLDKMYKDYIGHVFGVAKGDEKPMCWM